MKKLLEENDTLMQTTPTTHPPAWVSPIYKPNFLSKNPANDVNVHLEIYNNVFRMIPGHKKNTCPIEKWFWMPNMWTFYLAFILVWARPVNQKC